MPGPRLRAKVSDNLGNQDHQAFSQGKDGARVDLNGVRAAMQGFFRTDWGRGLDRNDPKVRELAETLVVAGGSGDRDPARLRRQAEVQSYNVGGFAGAALANKLFEEKAVTVGQQNQRLGLEERKELIQEDLGRRLGSLLDAMQAQEARSDRDQRLSWPHLGAIQAQDAHSFLAQEGAAFELDTEIDEGDLAQCLGREEVHDLEGRGLNVDAFSRIWAQTQVEQAKRRAGMDPMAQGEVGFSQAQAQGERIATALNVGMLNGRVADIAACGGIEPSGEVQRWKSEHAELQVLDPQQAADRNRINALTHPLGTTGAMIARAQHHLNCLVAYWNTAGVMPRKAARTGLEVGAGALKVGWAGVETGAGVVMATWALVHGWSEMMTSMGKDLASGKGPNGNLTSEALWGLGGLRAIKGGVGDGFAGVKQGVSSVSTASQTVDQKVDRVRTRSQAALNALQAGLDNAQRNAREGLENHQLYCNQVRKLFEAARLAATAPDDLSRGQAVGRMKGILGEMESLLEAMRTDTPSLAWSLESHPNLRLSVVSGQAQVVADMDCIQNEKLRGVLLRAGFNELDPKSERSANAHGEFSSVMDWGASADPEAVRNHLRKHLPAMENELQAPAFYGGPRLAVQAASNGEVAFYVVATKMGSTVEGSVEGVAGEQRFGAVGLPAMKVSVDRLEAVLTHLDDEARQGRASSRRLTTLSSRGHEGEPPVHLEVESGYDQDAKREWFKLSTGGDGVHASRYEINLDPEMVGKYLDQAKAPAERTDSPEVRWIREHVREDQADRLRAVAEEHAQLNWARRHLTGAQREAAWHLVEAQRLIGGLGALRGGNPYHQEAVRRINGALATGDPSSAGLTLDPIHLERIITRPLVEAENVSRMRTGMAFRESFMAAHEITEEQAMLDAMFLYAQSHASGVGA